MIFSTTKESRGSEERVLFKSDRLEARVSAQQKNLFQQAANLLGRSLTDFITSAVQEAALRVIQDYAILKLADQDKQLFIQSLLKPPRPNKRLIKAVKRYQKEVTSK